MSQWEFTLGGSQKDDPANIRDIELKLERDQDLKGVLRSVSSEIQWTGNAYTYLRGQYDTAYCGSVAAEIKYSCAGTPVSIFDGLLFLSDLRSDLFTCTASAELQDEHYTAKIRNNKQVRCYIGTGISKNGTTYTGATRRSIDFFDTASGASSGGSWTLKGVEAYTVADAFEDLVSFMTDDTVGFTNNVTDLRYLCICRGRAINEGTNTGFRPFVSFQELFEEVDKMYNIAFYIDTSGPSPVLVIDSASNVFGSSVLSTPSTALTKEVTEEIDVSKLYSSVMIGDASHKPGYEGYDWPDVQYLNHREEEYQIEGGCNVDNQLDLRAKYIRSSNTIEEVTDAVISTAKITDYDEDIFFVECNIGLTAATQYSTFDPSGTVVVYNFGLSNQQIIPRFDGVFQNNLAVYLGDGNDEFEATLTSSTGYAAAGANFEPVTYDTEVSDPNANYDNVTNYAYTAPADGWYIFSASVEISNYVSTGPSGSGDLEVVLTLRHYDGLGFGAPNLVNQSISPTITVTGDSEPTYAPIGLFLASGETVRIRIAANWNGPAPSAGSTFDIDGGTFECTLAETGGGVYAEFDPDDARNLLYEFEVPLSATDWATISANPRDKVRLTLPDGTTKDGWVDELRHNIFSGTGIFRIITTRNT